MFQPFLILRDALSTLLVLANFTQQEQKVRLQTSENFRGKQS
jgi:hypothetical protein